jgi:hypothetical protein
MMMFRLFFEALHAGLGHLICWMSGEGLFEIRESLGLLLQGLVAASDGR